MAREYTVTSVKPSGWEPDSHGNVVSFVGFKGVASDALMRTRPGNEPKVDEVLFGHFEPTSNNKGQWFKRDKREDTGSAAQGSATTQDARPRKAVDLDAIERLYRWSLKASRQAWVDEFTCDAHGWRDQIQAGAATLMIAAQKERLFPPKSFYDSMLAYFETHKEVQGDDAERAEAKIKAEYASGNLTEEQRIELLEKLNKASGVSEPTKDDDDVPW